MTRARVLQEVRQMRFEELYERRRQRILTMAEAGEMLGVTERTFRRWSGRYHAEGAERLQDRRIGRRSARAVPVDEALRTVTLGDATSELYSACFVEEKQYNNRFMVRATEPGTAFIPWVGPHLAEILCVQEERVVAKDITMRYQGLTLQIPQDPHRFYDVKVTV